MAQTRNALLSVYDKTGIEDFAQKLVAMGWTIYSSGGTAKVLEAAAIPVIDVATLVGGEAILGHRVVTLSREIHAGLLAQHTDVDRSEMSELGIPYLDLVCFNFYPLAEEIASATATTESVIEKTDIGGPAALSAGAKGGRIVVADPNEYNSIISWLEAGEPDKDAYIQTLRAAAFFAASRYYLPAATYHSGGEYDGIFGRRLQELTYGENPYMNPASLYETDTDDPLALGNFKLITGSGRSMIGITDTHRSLQLITHIAAGFDKNTGRVPHIAIGMKHGNPCGAAVGDNARDVMKRMIAGNARAIFGGFVMTNFPITQEIAEEMLSKDESAAPRLFDGIFAPSFDDAAPDILKRFKGKCRMMTNPALGTLSIDSLDTTPLRRYVRGGYILQPNYTHVLDIDASTSYGTPLTQSQKDDLTLAWGIGSVCNSNTISIVKHGMLIGNGVGQQDRVGAAELAVKRAIDAGHDLDGAVAYSDSFFPAPDGPVVLASAGVKVIFATSGSRRDDETIEACKNLDVSLLMQPDADARGFAQH